MPAAETFHIVCGASYGTDEFYRRAALVASRIRRSRNVSHRCVT